MAKAHQHQFPATPFLRTMSVTRFGVSLLKVVATMERPASHQGTLRPETKNSEVLLPARFPKKSAGTKHTSNEAMMMSQSISWRRMGLFYLTAKVAGNAKLKRFEG